MYYWNQESFEGLKAIADFYQHDAQLGLFAEYCMAREKGLRKQAFQKLYVFIDACKAQPFEQQKIISLKLLNLIKNHGYIYTLHSAPLNQYCIEVMQTWQQDEPNTVLIYEWLGYLTHDLEYYRQGYALDPHNQICIKAIISQHIYQVDWQTHHLSDSYLIGNLEHAWTQIHQASQLLPHITDADERNKIEQEIEEYRVLLTAWQNYQADQQERLEENKKLFPQWCQEQDLDFHFGMTYHYTK